MSTTPTTIGKTTLTEIPGSPRIEEAETDRIVRTFEGPKAAVDAYRASIAIGAALVGSPGGMLVENIVRAATETDGVWRIQVTLTGNTTISLGTAPYEEVLEREWVAVAKDLRYHPIYMPGGAKELNDAARRAIDTALRDGGTPPFDPTSNAGHLYTRLLRGQDVWEEFAPVIRRTSYRNQPSSNSQAGKIEALPSGAPAPSGSWTYRKSVDREVRRGRGAWERHEEWQGAEFWDTDIIGTA